MKNKLFLLFFFSLIFADIWAQDNQEYIIVTFVRERNKDNHKEQSYYWILERDRSKVNGFIFYPLYLEGYSNNDITKCCGNDTVDIFTITTATNYDFKEDYLNEVENLTKLISDSNKKVQNITKKWEEGYKEKVKVYVTPINGMFCSCFVNKESVKKINGNEMIYLPMPSTKFETSKNYWETKKSRDIKFFDYSIIGFVNTPD